MTIPKGKSATDHMAERMGLAQTFADDGAFVSAASVLSDLAKDLHEFGVWRHKQMEAAMAGEKSDGR